MTKHNLAVVVNGVSDARVVAKRVVKACEEVKGRDITVLDVRSQSDVSDYLVVVSGRSDRQVQGIANRIVDDLAALGIEPLSIEGFEDAQWILIDCGDVVVHVFYEPVRSYYDIEGIWMRAKKVDLASPAPRRAAQYEAARP